LDLLKIVPSRLGALMRATERLQESVAVVSNKNLTSDQAALLEMESNLIPTLTPTSGQN
jgi:hypothetical protein